MQRRAEILWANLWRGYWSHLVAGRHIPVPATMPHPREAGFAFRFLAEPNGQLWDWVLRLNDGSRLHVHEYGDGRLVLHRDAIDPERSIGALISHGLKETWIMPAAILAGIALFAVASSSKAA